ncbi:MAG: hypothetical protein EWV86_14670 [Microcystis panniformis Mp_MB_F_20051200_S9D]|nr:MAG: hypothetical protein EWV86_14670 [Microcystis panniformis Mp_MB_F_20051200_S9D]
MARAYIDGHLILRYSDSPAEIYWTAASTFISEKYGPGNIVDHKTVELALFDSFNFMAGKFKTLVYEEGSFKFFQYVFHLHEESIKVYKKHTFEGLSLHPVGGSEFAMYRRILKNVLEQGCDIDLEWGEFPTAEEVYRMDAKMQNLIYLGRWLYDLADSIALHKMVNNFHSITFNAPDDMVIDFQGHNAKLYDGLFPELQEHYESAIADDQSVHKLRGAIESCFGIDYDFAGGVIFEIKRHFSESEFETVQLHVLPQNLVAQFGVSIEEASRFYEGLTLSRSNKMCLEDLVYKPYNMNRYMFRPILVYKIGGEDRALVGKQKFAESIFVMSTNAIHWNALPKEWLQNRSIEQFLSKMGNEHDKILEDAIEEKIQQNNFLFARNIKSFKQGPGINNVNIDNSVVGEIDFIIVNEKLRKIFVADSKYNRARYEVVGLRNDYSIFIQTYEPKLEKKTNWIRNNLPIVTAHFQVIYNRPKLDLAGFKVEGVFFINTPTFYMLNGKYKAITLKQLSSYLLGRQAFKSFTFKNPDPNAEYMYDIISHPYFTR